MKTVLYPTPTIKCEGCKSTITGALTPLTGVNNVDVDLESKRVSVDYDENLITDEQIKQHINQAGFPVPDLETRR